MAVELQAVRRGGRQRLRPDATADQTQAQLNHMLQEAARREREALELAALFDQDDTLTTAEPQPLTARALRRPSRHVFPQGGAVS